ncbi:LysE family translocator [Shewanella sp. 10N.7]|uniref:LysE family translocator n=1 Tax=Shewanella sp. 10N.7 TaxID=2885093 RepID=UPI001E43D6C6|nr:LysE family translocator [Shewanella sp. 10N.7]MCC4831511.1 LysE family translocator [Shewanella sp. 10N.7]
MIESLMTLVIATSLLLGSPGPVPIALAAIGATFGVKQGLPFLCGILSGLLLVILATVLGLSALFTAYPNFRIICQIIASLYMVHIAFKIATASVVPNIAEQSAPKYRDGLVLNVLNPKAYAAFIAIFSQFLLPLSHTSISYLMTAVICIVVAALVDSLWLVFGSLLKPVFSSPKHAKAIRLVFAILLVITVLVSLVFSLPS